MRSRMAVKQSHIRAAVALRPDAAVAWNNLGMSQLKISHTDEAIDSLKEAIRLCPESAAARFNLAQTYLQLGKRTDAATQFCSASQFEPDSAKIHAMIGD